MGGGGGRGEDASLAKARAASTYRQTGQRLDTILSEDLIYLNDGMLG